MNENENTPVNSVVDEDWGEISLDDIFTAEAEPEAEETTGEGTEEKADPEANQQTGGEDEESHDDADTAESFVLKHLGTEQTVGRDEVIALAQKGLDYSRIRDKLQTSETEKSEIAEKLSYFEKLADSQGKTLDQFIEATAAALRADEKKIPYEDALREVQFEFEKSKFAKEKTDWEKSRSDTETEENTRQADIDAFMAKYPEAAAKPDSVTTPASTRRRTGAACPRRRLACSIRCSAVCSCALTFPLLKTHSLAFRPHRAAVKQSDTVRSMPKLLWPQRTVCIVPSYCPVYSPSVRSTSA